MNCQADFIHGGIFGNGGVFCHEIIHEVWGRRAAVGTDVSILERSAGLCLSFLYIRRY